MKTFISLFLLLTAGLANAQSSSYILSSYLEEGTKAPNTHYLGEAWLNRLLNKSEDLDFGITKARFKANSTLDWHKHASAQVLIVVEGEGYYIKKKEKNPFA